MSDTNWRDKELSLSQVIEKYQGDVPRLLIVKIDATRRGVVYSDAAAKLIDPNKHHVEPLEFYTADQKKHYDFPIGLTLRDGASICGGPALNAESAYRDPYVIDAIDGKPYLTDNGEIIEEVEFWERPDFYDKVTSNGTPMWQVASARPQRLTFTPGLKCHFWDKPGNGCKFCSLFSSQRTNDFYLRDEKYFQDVYETTKEAIKQKGRYASFHMSSGSTLSGRELFDDEVELYIRTFNAAERAFKDSAKKYPTKIVASAFSKKQLQRMYEETGITGYVTDLEVLDEKLFPWISPGKSEFVGFQGWKQRLYDAVDVFGRGQVHCGIVGGVEMAQPNGYTDEDAALKQVFSVAEELGEHGVTPSECVWVTVPKSYFAKQITPSLDYYVRLATGLSAIRQKNGLNVYIDDYRRCGNHPSHDLARIDKVD
jgi:hypothetical protein